MFDCNNDFDYTYELFKAFTTANNGQGLSERDIQNILDVFREAKRVGGTLQYETLEEFKQYRDRMKECREGGWTVVDITVTERDLPGLDAVVSAPFYHRDMILWLESILNKFVNKEGFVLRASMAYDSENERLYNEPHACDAWLYLQSKIPESGIIAALQLYSDKSLVNMKNLSAHPIRATLFNLPYKDRIKNLDGVGYLPELSRPAHVKNDGKWRMVKLVYMSKALDVLLSPLKVRWCNKRHMPLHNMRCVTQASSLNGLRITCSNGNALTVFPRLLSYVLDDPEGKDITGIKSAPSEHCCEQCWVPFRSLADIDSEWQARSEEEQRKVYEALCDPTMKKNKAKEIQRQYSTHKVACGLWGFADQATGIANSLNSFGFESMHNEDLGVFVYIIDHSESYFKEVLPTAKAAQEAIANLNQRLLQLPRWGAIGLHVLVSN